MADISLGGHTGVARQTSCSLLSRQCLSFSSASPPSPSLTKHLLSCQCHRSPLKHWLEIITITETRPAKSIDMQNTLRQESLSSREGENVSTAGLRQRFNQPPLKCFGGECYYFVLSFTAHILLFQLHLYLIMPFWGVCVCARVFMHFCVIVCMCVQLRTHACFYLCYGAMSRVEGLLEISLRKQHISFSLKSVYKASDSRNVSRLGQTSKGQT